MRIILAGIVLISTFMVNTSMAQTAPQVLVADTVTGVEGYRDDADRVAPINVNDPALPFARALRVDRATASDTTFAAALLWPTTAPINKGDLLVATLYVRNATPKQGVLNLDLTFQLRAEPYTPTFSSAMPVDSGTWRKYAIPFRAVQDLPAGGTTLQVRYSLAKQSFEVGGVAVVNYGQVAARIPKSITDTFAYYYPGRGDPKAPWRVAALRRIDAIRKGKMILRVLDVAGNPVPAAAVKLRQVNAPFTWGTAASAISLVCKVEANDTGRDCPTLDQTNNKPVTRQDYRRLRKELLANFNGSSFYNDLKWTDWHYDQQIALDGIAWMKRNKLPLTRGHNLIWPSFEPDYLMPRDVINRTTPAADVRRVIADHFRQQLGVLKGQIPEWDVVNEPFTNTDIQGRLASPNVKAVKGILPVSAVATWFRDARKYDPDAVLFLNEFAILDNANPAKLTNTIALINDIKRRGAPVDGIGFQGHFGASGPVFSDMQRAVDAFAPLVKTMSLTEFDFETLDPAMQRDLMDDVMTFIYSQPQFNLFQMWGFWDGDHWLGNGPLFNHDWSLKSSGAVWKKLTQQTWRTNATAVTDTAGRLSLNAFYGEYQVVVTVAGKNCVGYAQFQKSGTVDVRTNCRR